MGILGPIMLSISILGLQKCSFFVFMAVYMIYNVEKAFFLILFP